MRTALRQPVQFNPEQNSLIQSRPGLVQTRIVVPILYNLWQQQQPMPNYVPAIAEEQSVYIPPDRNCLPAFYDHFYFATHFYCNRKIMIAPTIRLFYSLSLFFSLSVLSLCLFLYHLFCSVYLCFFFALLFETYIFVFYVRSVLGKNALWALRKDRNLSLTY